MKKPFKDQFKEAVENAKKTPLGKKVIENKGIIAGGIANAATAVYAARKGGAKMGLAAAAGGLVWTGLSALYFKAVKAQEAEEQAQAERAERAAEPAADPFAKVKKDKGAETAAPAAPVEGEAAAEGTPKKAKGTRRKPRKNPGPDAQP